MELQPLLSLCTCILMDGVAFCPSSICMDYVKTKFFFARYKTNTSEGDRLRIVFDHKNHAKGEGGDGFLREKTTIFCFFLKKGAPEG